MRKSKSGFTIVELIVVVVIIGILASIVIVAYSGAQARSRDARRKSDIANIIKAMELYYNDNGQYPAASGTSGSSINGSWYTSGDSSWAQLDTALVGSNAIDATPLDPTNSAGSPMSTGNYGYGIYVNKSTYCGTAVGQMYLIVYRLENSPQEKFSDGACTSNPLGDSYYTSNGISYYRNAKGGL